MWDLERKEEGERECSRVFIWYPFVRLHLNFELAHVLFIASVRGRL